MATIDDLCSSKTVEINNFLRSEKQGLIIPTYQRSYTWDDNNSKQLFDDFLRFIHNLLMTVNEGHNINEYQILGSVILVNTDESSVDEQYKKFLPRKRLTVVDGQQRITTIMMLNIILHNLISKHYSLCKNLDIDIEFEEFLKDTVQETLVDLHQTFILNQSQEINVYSYYPRMIRSFVDNWARNNTAQYNSPVSKLIFSYNAAFFNQIKWNTSDIDRVKDSEYDNLIFAYNNIEKALNLVLRRNEQELGFQHNLPTLHEMMINSEFSQEIGVNTSDSNFNKYWTILEKLRKKDTEEIIYPTIHDLMSLIYIAKYIEKKVIFNTLIIENENSALDLFESLNTTGEPLTSFETLIPVVEKEEVDYQNSESKILINKILY